MISKDVQVGSRNPNAATQTTCIYRDLLVTFRFNDPLGKINRLIVLDGMSWCAVIGVARRLSGQPLPQRVQLVPHLKPLRLPVQPVAKFKGELAVGTAGGDAFQQRHCRRHPVGTTPLPRKMIKSIDQRDRPRRSRGRKLIDKF